MNIIKGRKLSYEYQKLDEEGNVEEMIRAVDDVDLDVKAGDFVAILGHNGSGKSTLAKHLNAILIPTEGTLYVDGKDTKDESKLWRDLSNGATTEQLDADARRSVEYLRYVFEGPNSDYRSVLRK